MIFYVGGERDARNIMVNQKRNISTDEKFITTKKIVNLAEQLETDLINDKLKNISDVKK